MAFHFQQTGFVENPNCLQSAGGPRKWPHKMRPCVTLWERSLTLIAFPLRSWRDRFGAELVALGDDTMALRVSRPPQSREEALNLAREHYLYCTETAGENVGTLSNSAAYLLGKSWWHFWWG
jgi:hypothetical protein